MLSSHIDFALRKCLIMAFQMNELIKFSHSNTFCVMAKVDEDDKEKAEKAPTMMKIEIHLNGSDEEEIGKKKRANVIYLKISVILSLKTIHDCVSNY